MSTAAPAAIVEAAATGDVAKVLSLLPEPANPSYGMLMQRALDAAIKNQQHATLRGLLDASPPERLVNYAMVKAATYGNLGAAKMLSAENSMAGSIRSGFFLGTAASHGHYDLTHYFLSSAKLDVATQAHALASAVEGTCFKSPDRRMIELVSAYIARHDTLATVLTFYKPLKAAAQKAASDLLIAWLPKASKYAITTALKHSDQAPIETLTILARAASPNQDLTNIVVRATLSDRGPIVAALVAETGHTFSAPEALRSAIVSGDMGAAAFMWEVCPKNLRSNAFAIALRKAVELKRMEAVEWLLAKSKSPAGSVRPALEAAISADCQEAARRLLPYCKVTRPLLRHAFKCARGDLSTVGHVLAAAPPAVLQSAQDDVHVVANKALRNQLTAAIDHRLLSQVPPMRGEPSASMQPKAKL